MACAICDTRRPRRFCPGVGGNICSWCCGNEREVTVDCPLDCEYLQEARKHEKPVPIEASEVPNRDIPLTEKFLHDNEELLAFLSAAILRTMMETPGVIDFDVREALEGLIRTYRTLQSGVYYESRPVNPIAVRIYAALQDASAEYRKTEHEQFGITRTRDSDVLGMLVFLQHFELDQNNGRRRGRAFLDALHRFYSPVPVPDVPPTSSLILP